MTLPKGMHICDGENLKWHVLKFMRIGRHSLFTETRVNTSVKSASVTIVTYSEVFR